MKFFKISGLIIGAAVLSAGVKLISRHPKQNVQAQIIHTKKYPNITAAERVVKDNLPAILWLFGQKVKFNDCQWMNG